MEGCHAGRSEHAHRRHLRPGPDAGRALRPATGRERTPRGSESDRAGPRFPEAHHDTELVGAGAGPGAEYRQLERDPALALLDLPGPVQQHVERGELSPSVAYEVHKIEDEDGQVEVATRIVSEGLNRSDAIQAVKAKKAGRPAPDKPSRHTIKLDDGTRIIVEGTAAAAGEAAIADALAQARKRILAVIREGNRGEAA